MEYLPFYKDSLYLVHHGIKGQKWGIRRYQNPDGSLTEAGKAREKRWKGPDTFRYRRLNRKADRGDRLRAEGKTINTTARDLRYRSLAVTGATLGAHFLMRDKGVNNIRLRYGETPLIDINHNTIRAGQLAAIAVMSTMAYRDMSDIRSSYRRQQNGQYWAG